jgi:rhamnose transport system ATP-binding protein
VSDAPAPLLRLVDVSKRFGGVQALSAVSFELAAGEVHALVGENGAGKSTLVRIITGAHRPDSGTLEVRGERIVDADPGRLRACGVAPIYQQPAIFPELSVAENIAFGIEPRSLWRRIDWPRRRRIAAGLLGRVGARLDVDQPASTLRMAEQQLVEIARALGANARVLLMDEPTASLTASEAERLFTLVRVLRDDGVGVIYISHRLEEVEAIADRVTVLRDGRHVATRAMVDLDRAELIRLMVGRSIDAVFPKRAVTIGEVVLDVEGVGCAASALDGVALQVRAGEIVGLAGLVGAGRTELARTLFGLTPADRGRIRLDGALVRVESPAQAVALGLAYVPEDRRRHGVIPEMSVAANTSLAALGAVSRHGWLDTRVERALAARFVERFAVRAASLDAAVDTLSGGNQQKVALARWLATKPRVLILDEPTQGVDVGAKAEIHALIVELAAQGLAILLISSELPEILGMCDRIAVMRLGRLVATLDRADATPERLLALAIGDTASSPSSSHVSPAGGPTR